MFDFDVLWGVEVVFEGEIIVGECEYEGLFGEFIGYYFGGCSMLIIKIKCVYYRNNLIFEYLYLGMFWIECDYMIGINICVLFY